MNTYRCDSCINTRSVISENGMHHVCVLSDREMMDCMMGKKDHYFTFKLNTDDTEEEKN